MSILLVALVPTLLTSKSEIYVPDHTVWVLSFKHYKFVFH